jgi:hypothetical protein
MSRAQQVVEDFCASSAFVPADAYTLAPSEASTALDALGRIDRFRELALERGTTAAELRLVLNARVAGAELNSQDAGRLARATVNSSSYADWDPTRPGGPAGPTL